MGVCVPKAKHGASTVVPDVDIVKMPKLKMNLMGSILDMKKVRAAPVLNLDQSPLYKKRIGPGSPTSLDSDSILTGHRSAFLYPESPEASDSHST